MSIFSEVELIDIERNAAEAMELTRLDESPQMERAHAAAVQTLAYVISLVALVRELRSCQ